ncbi:MAG TPA: ABC transporter ATP-binding protein [Candidatus Polarisedimenticolaceae bacterium]|nr:ABC transporter ATP-binding protein [Candidatus Polarisedimenticolaceae bacterium]
MIDVQGLVKRYGDHAALDGVTFAVAAGEIVGFLGPNGAGKTTTLRILSTYLSPDGGTARVAGHDVASAPMEVRRRLGYLPEHPPVDLDQTVREYLDFCAALRNVPRRKRRAAGDGVIARCGLSPVAGRLIGNLSKGFRQRVGLAQALVHGPEVVILDEPTVGLDPHQIREIRELIRSLAGDHTVLLSSHILPEVAMTCSRAVVVHRGRVAADVSLDAGAAGGGLEETFLRVTSADAALGEAS